MTDFLHSTNSNGITEYFPFPSLSSDVYCTPRVEDILVTHLEFTPSGLSTITKNIPTTFECPICYETIPTSERVTNSCEHHMCVDCTLKHLDTVYRQELVPCCPLCRHHMIVLETPDKTIYERIGDYLYDLPDEELEDTIRCDPYFTRIIEFEIAENILED